MVAAVNVLNKLNKRVYAMQREETGVVSCQQD